MDQLEELIGFLSSDRNDVKTYATNYVMGFTKPGTEYFDFFVKRADKVIPPLLDQCKKDTLIAHDSVRALINITSAEEPRACFDSVDILTFVVKKIIDTENVIADLYCMLLSNLCKNVNICHKILGLRVEPPSNFSSSTSGAEPNAAKKIKNSDGKEVSLALDYLTDLFLHGVSSISPNKKANFDFLASVFAELTTIKEGRDYFVTPTPDGKCPLTKVIVFTEYPELIRRGGSINVIKNQCFSPENACQMLDEDGINILPYILLPLCGNEDFDDDDMDGMPTEVQLLPEDKARETDVVLRLSLVESLILLCATRESREILRARKVYPIVRVLHNAETDNQIADAIDRLVQLLMRDEQHQPQIQEIEESTIMEDFEEI